MSRFAILIVSLLLLSSIPSFTQQLPLYSQYRELQSIINPAAVNADFLSFQNNVSFAASYRNQWTGLTNSPTTAVIRGDFLGVSNSGFNIMFGGHVIHDQTGPTGFTGAYGKLGGIISDDPSFGGIAVALNFGMVQYRVDVTEIIFRDENDIRASENQKKVFPDAGFGVFMYRQVGRGSDADFIYGGVSVPQLFGLDLSFKDENDEFFLKRSQHIYGLIGYYKFFNDGSFLEPSFWIKSTQNAPINIDATVRYNFPNSFWLGTGAGSNGNLHFETGFVIGDYSAGTNVKIGYGFDYLFSKISPVSRATHEFNISYSFDY